MDTLIDYIGWMGSFDFDAVPFSEPDAMVLCLLSYFDLSPALPSPDSTTLLKDCAGYDLPVKITGGDMGYTDVLRAVLASKRYGELTLSGYVDLFRPDPPVQFSAVVFTYLDRFSFLAFRGTDNTIAGWKEDFMISFTRTHAQEMALDYAKAHIQGRGRFYLGGHSKGGNLALYAACLLPQEQWEQLERVYLLDCPGLCPEVMDPALLDRVDPKATRIIPEFSVVGKLFEPAVSDTRIVPSTKSGILQHAVTSWGIDHGGLALVDENAAGSQWLNETVDRWIKRMGQEERLTFTNELFGALAANGAVTLDDIAGGGPEGFEAILTGIMGASDVTKQVIADLPRQAIQDGAPQPKASEKGTLQRLLDRLGKSELFQALALIAGGVAMYLASDSLLEIISLLFFLSLTMFQCYLTVKRLKANGWRPERVREMIYFTIILLALCAVIVVKEKAMFLLGSLLFGVLFLLLAFRSSERAVKCRNDLFLRVLYLGEGLLSAIYGISFLVIPQATVFAYAISIGVALAADGLLRLIHLFLLKRKA